MEQRQTQSGNVENNLSNYQLKQSNLKCIVCEKDGELTSINTIKDYQLLSPYQKQLIFLNRLQIVCCSNGCLEKYNLRRLLLLAGCPLNLVNFDGEYIYAEHKDLLNKYVLSDRGLFLWADTGRIKSSFAVTLMREYLKKGEYSMQFISVPKLIEKLYATYSDFGKEITQLEILEKISSYKLLILDDIGANKTTDTVKQGLYYIINDREANCLKTILTSNLSLPTLDKSIDTRISSRIGGMCDVVHFGGTDRRLVKHQ